MTAAARDAVSWLLLNSLQPGLTAAGESGRRFHAKPESGETWLLFATDTDAFRERFFASKSAPVCDYLVIFFRKEAPPTIACVELKGADSSHACKQLDSTLRGLRGQLDSLWKVPAVRWRAIIVGKGSAPRNLSREMLKFRKEHGAVLESISANQADIGTILRSKG